MQEEYEHYESKNELDVKCEYWELWDEYEGIWALSKEEIKFVKEKLKEFIKRAPDFFDPYLDLQNIYLKEHRDKSATKIYNTAYEKVLKLITNKKGEWPKNLSWGIWENRPLIRVLLRKAEEEWHLDNREEALRAYMKILMCNPDDHPGVRYYIVAISEGLTEWDFHERFINEEDCMNPEIFDWFNEKVETTESMRWWVKYAKKWNKKERA